MQVYQGFDIGTDKPSINKMENIPHHLLDIASPSAQFTAADFVRLSLKAMDSIWKRKKLPIITGGTGLYLKALLEGLFPEGEKNPFIRQTLEREAEEKDLTTLWNKLRDIDPVYAEKIGANDKIRIIRALEVYYATNKPLSKHFLETKSFVKDFHTIKIGLKLERKKLYELIDKRVEQMFAKGLVKEVQDLLEKGVSTDSPPFRALGYKYVLQFLNKGLTLEESILLTKKDTRHYAKRQLTWFKKMKGIKWFFPEDFQKIVKYIQNNLK